MTRSQRHGLMECYSDEFNTTEARDYSHKAHRKRVRGVFGQAGREFKTELESQFPARDQMYWRSSAFSEKELEKFVELAEKTKDLKDFQECKIESKRNLKQRHQNEKFEEWCASKSTKKVRKTQKKLERNGLKTIFDSDETDSEVEEKLEKWNRENLKSVKEIKKYYETDSLMSFRQYRGFKIK